MLFPRGADGRRSTGAVGRQVVADALRGVDPAGARAADQETSWRTGYLVHFRRPLEAGLDSRDAAVTIAAQGLGSLYDRMVVRPGGQDVPADAWAFLATPTGTGSGTCERASALHRPPWA